MFFSFGKTPKKSLFFGHRGRESGMGPGNGIFKHKPRYHTVKI